MDDSSSLGPVTPRRTVLAAAATLGATLAAHRALPAAGAGRRPRPARLLGAHPRLVATANDFTDVLTRIGTDPTSAQWFGTLRALADELLTVPPPTFDSTDLQDIARTAVNRMYTLGMMYHLGGGAAYATRAWQEAAAIAAFPRWSRNDPARLASDFLPLAEMTHAMAIAYDWLYPWMTTAQRDVVGTAIATLGLGPAMDAYATNSVYVTSSNNVGIVTNSGFGLGALAIADEQPTLANQVLAESLAKIRPGIEQLGPDGASPEGSYWGYIIRYLGIYLAALDTALTTDPGLSAIEGVSETGYYTIHLTGPTNQFFNYSDSDAPAMRPPELMWLANKYDKPDYTWMASSSASTATLFVPRYLLWYDPAKNLSPAQTKLPRDSYFRTAEVATFRSAWQDPDAVFAAFKAGDTTAGHAHLDLGTFVVDALGQRWVAQLGKDNYSLPGYFDYGPDGQRWTYYRNRAEGQNTIVVNPTDGPDQRTDASCRIIRRASATATGFAIADLTAAVPGTAVTSWQRGLAIVDTRRQVVVQDELASDEPVEAWWFMHTAATITVSADGRSALLERGGASLLARLLDAPAGAQFSVRDAVPLPTSPAPSGQAANTGMRKLTVALFGATSFRLVVLLTPLVDPEAPAPAPPGVLALQDWYISNWEA